MPIRSVSLTDNGLGDKPRAQAAGAHRNGTHFAVSELVAHILEIGVENALGFDVGVAHVVADLRFFAAHFTLLGHDILPYTRTVARKRLA